MASQGSDAGAHDDALDDDMGFLCLCGNFENSGYHCSDCGREPPWGCECSQCAAVADEGDDLDVARGDYADWP